MYKEHKQCIYLDMYIYLGGNWVESKLVFSNKFVVTDTPGILPVPWVGCHSTNRVIWVPGTNSNVFARLPS